MKGKVFGLLTTVNHPDVIMWLINVKPWQTWLSLMSYMYLTFVIALNMLLAVVYGEYIDILAENLETRAALRAAMLQEAFNLLCPR